jgi:hypothetical protein
MNRTAARTEGRTAARKSPKTPPTPRRTVARARRLWSSRSPPHEFRT